MDTIADIVAGFRDWETRIDLNPDDEKLTWHEELLDHQIKEQFGECKVEFDRVYKDITVVTSEGMRIDFSTTFLMLSAAQGIKKFLEESPQERRQKHQALSRQKRVGYYRGYWDACEAIENGSTTSQLTEFINNKLFKFAHTAKGLDMDPDKPPRIEDKEQERAALD